MQLQKGMFRKEYFWKWLISVCGIIMIVITIVIGAFLIYKGSYTFTGFGHSIGEFLFSAKFSPNDSYSGSNGSVGAAVFIVGSVLTCGLALLISTPFSLAAAIFMTEISPKFGNKFFQPAVEIFVGIPSIVYGWTGLTVLVPAVRDVFNLPYGNSVFTAALVLALMIFPSITSVATDAIRGVPSSYRDAAYGMGSTRWQIIKNVVLPAASSGIMTGIILGLARAFGEALAVAMVIGKTRVFPKNIFSSTSTLTSVIASNMGNTFDGTEYNSALWSMALLLFIISLLFIFLIHFISAKGEKKANGKD
ncbi:MAG: phosphate ABC transporter permease subunit PstC [Clostridia bacterium]|jgi:phosphate transport system permease protein|nr:phosphate ABC transporter permease subunit PstC [Clostridia bacterium]MCI2001222.1 phosphate ABC transporter permease subunit PstC [Clostridia bacterium]MCI2015910.1 phosphate ABC transporter permease subunit PstC [Clostridia bacterium]